LTRFRLTAEPIDDNSLLSADSAAGAISTFVGIVRNHNEGRPVQRLEYESYPELAQREGERIVAEALAKFPILDAVCVHRTGTLEIGEVAIRAETAGAHRREVIRACEWIVEEVKRRVPIWKKEHYADGDSGWVNATTPGKAVVEADAYYARQQTLLELDQSRLSGAHVLVVGAGGLGCPALLYLAGAGVGHITIVDPDRVEVSNLHRQVLFGVDDLGIAKATAAARRLRSLNPLIQIQAIVGRLEESNVFELVEAHHLVLDGTDRLTTKFLLNRVSVGLRKPLIVASVHRFEGQIQVVRPDGPCLQCLWPEPPEDGCVGTCAETGVLGVTPGLLGTMQAAEGLKLLLGFPTLEGVSMVDLLRPESRKLKLARREDCPICGQGAQPLKGFDPTSMELLQPDLADYESIDIRERDEVAIRPSGLPNVPLSAWKTPAANKPLLLVCASGRRSLALAKRLRGEGVSAYSLAGGVQSLG
jgi:adenylyltransferase/sulfurtransferase